MPVCVSIWLSRVEKRAVVELRRARAVERRHRQRRARGDARLDLGHAVLRHRELDVDRRQLGDHGDAVGVAGADGLPTSTGRRPTRPAIGATMRV